MSVGDPVGMLIFGVGCVVGILGWRLTRRPVEEWGAVAANLKRRIEARINGAPASPRPNNSLERSRER